ncbi:exonuclease SbcCD subunit D [Aquipuribacter sp. SD81]|uniref:exonuclease SbcCD subunit D n=1 Tax=Aquipuribacter sp. SD81 TaxID=3127703 RepID=UPI003016D7F9
MRLLHTSDWHLGRRLHGVDLLPAHTAWVEHLVEVVRSEAVDVVLVAGDVFDRAVPPVEAVRLWDEAVLRLVDAGAVVVASSGNHDSPTRLGAHADLLARSAVHVRCDPGRVAEPVVLDDRHGPVALYPLPYLDPLTTAGPLGVPGARTQAAVVARAAALATAAARSAGRGRTVALAHTWVAGVRPEDRCDSERDISGAAPGDGARVGTLDRVPTDAFAGLTYTALGHLHGPQVLGEALRYSGSPVAFSFSERRHAKGSWLVELDASGLAAVERVPAPVHRPLVQLEGPLEELLSRSDLEEHTGSHVKAVLTDPVRPADAMRRLQARFPHALALEWAPAGDREPALPYRTRLAAARSDTDVVAGFVDHVRGAPASDAELAALDEAVRAVAARDVEALVPPRPPERPEDELLAVDEPADATTDLLAALDGSDGAGPARGDRGDRGAA